MGTHLQVALTYAAYGWHVFPAHSIVDGRCTCGKECISPGKHPRTIHGLNDATTKKESVTMWWTRWPMANIGISTGPSKLAVIDIDPRHGGDETWKAIDPHIPTLTSQTGSGGFHHIYGDPDGAIRNSESKLGAGIDTRGVGGYIIAPPSANRAGAYRWIVKVKVAPFPKVLRSALIPVRQHVTPVAHVPVPAGNLSRATVDFMMRGSPQGQRNTSLFKAACDMAGNGYAQANAEAALIAISGLPDQEARRTINEAYKKPRIPARPPLPQTYSRVNDMAVYEERILRDVDSTQLSDLSIALAFQMVERIEAYSNLDELRGEFGAALESDGVETGGSIELSYLAYRIFRQVNK